MNDSREHQSKQRGGFFFPSICFPFSLFPLQCLKSVLKESWVLLFHYFCIYLFMYSSIYLFISLFIYFFLYLYLCFYLYSFICKTVCLISYLFFHKWVKIKKLFQKHLTPHHRCLWLVKLISSCIGLKVTFIKIKINLKWDYLKRDQGWILT